MRNLEACVVSYVIILKAQAWLKGLQRRVCVLHCATVANVTSLASEDSTYGSVAGRQSEHVSKSSRMGREQEST